MLFTRSMAGAFLHRLRTLAAHSATQVHARHALPAGQPVYLPELHAPGSCLAAFYPDVVGPVRQGPHFQYHWDGQRISRVTEARDVAY